MKLCAQRQDFQCFEVLLHLMPLQLVQEKGLEGQSLRGFQENVPAAVQEGRLETVHGIIQSTILYVLLHLLCQEHYQHVRG